MEKQAYLEGNMCFRDFEDKYKQDPEAMRQKILNSENNNMKPLNEWKNEEMFRMLMEKFVPKAKEDEEEDTEESELDDKDLANNTPPEDKVTRGDVIAQAKHNAKK
jgi:polyhydroxyalkanoate synthesis regulator protein